MSQRPGAPRPDRAVPAFIQNKAMEAMRNRGVGGPMLQALPYNPQGQRRLPDQIPEQAYNAPTPPGPLSLQQLLAGRGFDMPEKPRISTQDVRDYGIDPVTGRRRSGGSSDAGYYRKLDEMYAQNPEALELAKQYNTDPTQFGGEKPTDRGGALGGQLNQTIPSMNRPSLGRRMPNPPMYGGGFGGNFGSPFGGGYGGRGGFGGMMGGFGGFPPPQPSYGGGFGGFPPPQPSYGGGFGGGFGGGYGGGFGGGFMAPRSPYGGGFGGGFGGGYGGPGFGSQMPYGMGGPAFQQAYGGGQQRMPRFPMPQYGGGFGGGFGGFGGGMRY